MEIPRNSYIGGNKPKRYKPVEELHHALYHLLLHALGNEDAALTESY